MSEIRYGPNPAELARESLEAGKRLALSLEKKTYSINECFYSLQGEGARAGSANVFLRFAGCNLQCVDADLLRPLRKLKGNEIDAGFFCDTDFAKGTKLDLQGVVELVKKTDGARADGGPGCRWVILTGGEPTLQVDAALIAALRSAGYCLAMETNGLRVPPPGLEWISCSPKRGTFPELRHAQEIRVVLGNGEEPDTRGISADHYFVSPKFQSVPADELKNWTHTQGDLLREDLEWAIDYCLAHPRWKLSLQAHKVWGVH